MHSVFLRFVVVSGQSFSYGDDDGLMRTTLAVDICSDVSVRCSEIRRALNSIRALVALSGLSWFGEPRPAGGGTALDKALVQPVCQ